MPACPAQDSTEGQRLHPHTFRSPSGAPQSLQVRVPATLPGVGTLRLAHSSLCLDIFAFTKNQRKALSSQGPSGPPSEPCFVLTALP